MEIQHCKICSAESKSLFRQTILKKYEIEYFQCPSCGFTQTEPVYWLNEAYSSSMNMSDTGIVLRNSRFSRVASSILMLFFGKNHQYVDYAGGYGLFTRMMRDTGFNFFWTDPYTENILAKGFEMPKGKKYHLATSFESFEHFDKPEAELDKILEVSDNILFSTEMISVPAPEKNKWWYYSPEHGQHIAFYTKKSLEILADRKGLNYYNADNIHLITRKKLGLPGQLIFALPKAKYLLYALSFIFTPFLKSKTLDDQQVLIKKEDK